jgi:hypothetical protein
LFLGFFSGDQLRRLLDVDVSLFATAIFAVSLVAELGGRLTLLFTWTRHQIIHPPTQFSVLQPKSQQLPTLINLRTPTLNLQSSVKTKEIGW